jgi:hypothetical protein
MSASGLVLASVLSFAQAQEATSPAVDLDGKLYRAVFVPGPGTLTAADVEPLPAAVRNRLSQFLARRAAFKSLYSHEAGSFDQAREDAKKREIERATVALIDVPGIEARARDFVKVLRILIDWEQSWRGPVAEAASAEDVLKGDPSSVLAPYLYVFIAHRQRAAFEAYAAAQNVEGMKSSSRKYRTFLQRARSASDPIFGWIADDLDRQPYVYLKTEQHPSTFDPDT